MSNSSPFNIPIYGFNDVIDTKQLKRQTKKTRVKKSTVKKVTQNKLKSSSTDINTQPQSNNQTEVTDLNQTHKTKKKRTRKPKLTTEPVELNQVESINETNKPTNLNQVQLNQTNKPTNLNQVQLNQTKQTKVKSKPGPKPKSKVKSIESNETNQTEIIESNDMVNSSSLTKPIETNQTNEPNNITETKLTKTVSKPKKIKKTRVKRKVESKHVDKPTESNESNQTETIETKSVLLNQSESVELMKSNDTVKPNYSNVTNKPTDSNQTQRTDINQIGTTKSNTFNVMIDVSNVRECRCSLCNSVIQDNPVKATKFTGDIILTQSNQSGNLMFCDLLCARLYDTNVNHISINFNDYRMSYIKRQLSKKARSIYEKCADKLLTQLIVCKFSVNINELDETDKINYINTLKNDLLSKL